MKQASKLYFAARDRHGSAPVKQSKLYENSASRSTRFWPGGYEVVMWFSKTDGRFTRVNCGVEPNSDISGVGVRGALYLEAALAILLARFNQSAGIASLLLAHGAELNAQASGGWTTLQGCNPS